MSVSSAALPVKASFCCAFEDVIAVKAVVRRQLGVRLASFSASLQHCHASCLSLLVLTGDPISSFSLVASNSFKHNLQRALK